MMKYPINCIRLKWHFWAILIALSIILIACRTENTRESSPQPVTITFAGRMADRAYYESLIQKFQEQNPHIIVQYISLEEVLGEQVFSAEMQQLASLADVVLFDGRLPNEASSYFLDLESFIKADITFSPEDFWPGLLTGCQNGGSLVGVPIGVSANLIFFDGNAFMTAGLPYPQPGWTWMDFQQAVQQLAQETDNRKQYGFVMGNDPIFLFGPLVSDLFENEANLDALSLDSNLGWYSDLVHSDAIRHTTIEEREILINGRQAAMWTGSHFELKRLRNAIGNQVSILPFPVVLNSSPFRTTPLRPTCALISAGTQNPETAWSWIHFLTRQIPSDIRQDIPVRASIADASGYWTEWDEDSEETLRFALHHGWYGNYTAPLLTTVAGIFDQVLNSEISFSETLPAAVEVPPTQAPPAVDSTSVPVVVATPRATSTPVAVNVAPGETIVVEYYADLTEHHSREAIEALAKEFNEAQDRIFVKLFTDRPEFQDSYGIVEMAETYDCFVWGGPAIAFPQAIDRFYNLETLWVVEEASLRSDFYLSLLEQNRIMGELRALPVASHPFVIYYNVRHFDNYLLDHPTSDWTVDDFWELAAAGTREDAQMYGFVPNIWSTMDLLLFTPQSPSLYDINMPVLNATFDNSEVMQSLSWLDSMVDAGIMFPKDQTTPAQIQQQGGIIARGQAAMWVGLAGTNHGSLEVGVAPLPVTSAPLPIASSASAYISKRASNPIGCWEWLKFLSAHPNSFRGIPARKSILESPEWINIVGEETAAAYRTTLTRPVRSEPTLDDPNLYVPFPFFVWWEQLLQTVFAGAEPAEVLRNIQIKADRYSQCITAITTRSFDAVNNCAKQADPNFSPDF